MRNAARALIRTAGFAALTLSLAALAFAPTAFAQTMGEYGLTVSHSAGAASAMPKVAPPPLPTETNQGSTQTYEVPADAPGQADEQASDSHATASDKDANDDKPDGNWDQVK
jgi:hypothetical protein